MYARIKRFIIMWKFTRSMFKEVNVDMVFTPDMQLVKNAILCLTAGVYYSIEDLPDIGNFQEVVKEAMGQ